jgi:hypothetical protein
MHSLFRRLDAALHRLVVHLSCQSAASVPARPLFRSVETLMLIFFMPLWIVFRDIDANKQYYLFCKLKSHGLDFRIAGSGGLMFLIPRSTPRHR